MQAMSQTTEKNKLQRLRFMSYNVENLFDTINNVNYNDDDFTPEGKFKWDSQRYNNKIKHIAKVISRVGQWHWPAIIGLMEIENSSTIEDLINTTALKKAGYKYCLSHGEDTRGINVAFIYRPKFVDVMETKEYPIHFKENENKKSRNILHIKALLLNYIELNIFVCHLPSKREGSQVSEVYRCEVANIIRSKSDEIYKENPLSNILIMGDFNENPDDIALKSSLKTISEKDVVKTDKLQLINLFEDYKNKDIGSYYYKGHWDQLDQMILSSSFFDENSTIKYVSNSAKVYTDNQVMYENNRNGKKMPSRTYKGNSYTGGYSDHLPIYADFLLKVDTTTY